MDFGDLANGQRPKPVGASAKAVVRSSEPPTYGEGPPETNLVIGTGGQEQSQERSLSRTYDRPMVATRSYSDSNPWLENFSVRPFSVTTRTT